jgi:hypothetical protein
VPHTVGSYYCSTNHLFLVALPPRDVGSLLKNQSSMNTFSNGSKCNKANIHHPSEQTNAVRPPGDKVDAEAHVPVP